MRIIIFLISAVLSLLSFTGVVFAASCETPPSLLDIEKDRQTIRTEAIGNIEKCLAARARKQEATIQDFVCPSGEFNINERPHTNEILAHQIAIAVVFKKIDENALKFMQSLQCVREKDPLKWDKTLGERINGAKYQDPQSYEYLYKSFCTDFSRIASLINSPEKQYIQTSDTYPQYYDCMQLAQAKVNALNKLGGFLMSSGIGKSYENDKDVFLDQVKGRYAKLLEKTSRYFRLMGQAVSKIDKYLRETIQ